MCFKLRSVLSWHRWFWGSNVKTALLAYLCIYLSFYLPVHIAHTHTNRSSLVLSGLHLGYWQLLEWTWHIVKGFLYFLVVTSVNLSLSLGDTMVYQFKYLVIHKWVQSNLRTILCILFGTVGVCILLRACFFSFKADLKARYQMHRLARWYKCNRLLGNSSLLIQKFYLAAPCRVMGNPSKHGMLFSPKSGFKQSSHTDSGTYKAPSHAIPGFATDAWPFRVGAAQSNLITGMWGPLKLGVSLG